MKTCVSWLLIPKPRAVIQASLILHFPSPSHPPSHILWLSLSTLPNKPCTPSFLLKAVSRQMTARHFTVPGSWQPRTTMLHRASHTSIYLRLEVPGARSTYAAFRPFFKYPRTPRHAFTECISPGPTLPTTCQQSMARGYQALVQSSAEAVIPRACLGHERWALSAAVECFLGLTWVREYEYQHLFKLSTGDPVRRQESARGILEAYNDPKASS